MPFWDSRHLELLESAKVPVVQQELRLGPDNMGMHGQGSCHWFETCHHIFGLSVSGGTSGSLAHSLPHLIGTTAEGTRGATKSPQKKEKRVILSQPQGWGRKQGTYTFVGLSLTISHIVRV